LCHQVSSMGLDSVATHPRTHMVPYVSPWRDENLNRIWFGTSSVSMVLRPSPGWAWWRNELLFDIR
jgi:hypothetical protein